MSLRLPAPPSHCAATPGAKITCTHPHTATPLHSLKVVSLRSGATVSSPAPAQEGLQLVTAQRRVSTAFRSGSFLPSPSPMRQAAPRAEGAYPPPPGAVAPRFFARFAARGSLASAGKGAPRPTSPTGIQQVRPIRKLTHSARLAPAAASTNNRQATPINQQAHLSHTAIDTSNTQPSTNNPFSPRSLITFLWSI